MNSALDLEAIEARVNAAIETYGESTAAVVRDMSALIAEVRRLRAVAQGYYDEASKGWSAYREAERNATRQPRPPESGTGTPLREGLSPDAMELAYAYGGLLIQVDDLIKGAKGAIVAFTEINKALKKNTMGWPYIARLVQEVDAALSAEVARAEVLTHAPTRKKALKRPAQEGQDRVLTAAPLKPEPREWILSANQAIEGPIGWRAVAVTGSSIEIGEKVTVREVLSGEASEPSNPNPIPQVPAPLPVEPATAPLTWTKEKPKVPGQYWIRNPAVQITWIQEVGQMDDHLLTRKNLEFAGPIPEPGAGIDKGDGA